ncbi:MAG: hypothetical protein CENE_01309 [Candidatus Celerinatantimonas neptuna]|nr:MAG: hypothetical protein CENE_01309 [Candidatus Celerinatantimonas neptuna]
MKSSILYIFSGLPGVGKTTLSKALAKEKQASYLRIDTIEQGLRDLCQCDVEEQGYRLAYRLAAENLPLGDVVADSCNPIEITRRDWHRVAQKAAARFIDIEVICSDQNRHRQRVEKRRSDVEGLKLPSWEAVLQREFQSWHCERIVIDTAYKTCAESIDELNQACMQTIKKMDKGVE